MILDNLNLVHFVLNKFSFNKSEYEDLFQEGVIGLIKAEQTYDINKKNSFSTYACVCIKNEILGYLRKNNKSNLLSLNEELSNNNTFEDLLISEEKDFFINFDRKRDSRKN